MATVNLVLMKIVKDNLFLLDMQKVDGYSFTTNQDRGKTQIAVTIFF